MLRASHWLLLPEIEMQVTALWTPTMQVRSCTLDTWLPEQVRFMASTGNSVANAYWEARLPDLAKPSTSSPELEGFIRRKYDGKEWTQGSWPPPTEGEQMEMLVPVARLGS